MGNNKWSALRRSFLEGFGTYFTSRYIEVWRMKRLCFLLLCVISIGLCFATPSCHELQQSQLASLNERMTQMINSLYTSPIAAKAHLPPPLSSSNATPSDCPYDTAYYPYAYAPPQVIYVAPPGSYPPAPSIPVAPKPIYYPYTPEYPEASIRPSWSYYDQPYSVPPAYPNVIPYPSAPQAPPTSYPLPQNPYPPAPYPPNTHPSNLYPPNTYPQSYPLPTPYPPLPTYPYSWDSYSEFSKPPQGYPPVPPPYPYPRQPEIPPPVPYYA